MSNALKIMMHERNITQKDLALATGVTECTISRKMHNSREWKAPEIEKIMVAFNLTADEVVRFFLSEHLNK